MPSTRDFFLGPWRSVPVLGITQILTWGTLIYPPVLTVPAIAADRGWSASFAMSGFSLGLLVAGLVAPRVGAAIDRYGGHRVMPVGSLFAAFGFVALVHADTPVIYLAVWAALGVAMAASLYDSAFATLGRIFGRAARAPLTVLTLAGGFASTVSWPATHLLMGAVGWRGTYLVFAGLLVSLAAPLHAFALPRSSAALDLAPQDATTAPLPTPSAGGKALLLTAAAFASYAFVPSALAAHLLAIFQRSGIEPGTVVAIGTLFGPSQVAARLIEFLFARNIHPLGIARFAVALLVSAFALLAIGGLSAGLAAAFAVMFGIANGLITIARGSVPLALFGPVGYGRLIGRIAGPALLIQSAAPFVLAFVAERMSDPAALALVATFAFVALACFLAIRRPAGGTP